jgi:L-asparaginase
MNRKTLLAVILILISTSFTLFNLSLSAAVNSVENLPKIVIVGTGGTIAGKSESANVESYTAGKVETDELIKDVPGINKLADIKCLQYCNVPSQDISENLLVGLAEKVDSLVKQKDVDGIVITHGTDTMEETAYFLNLTIHTKKPIVITGSMRPSNSISADGPINIYNSVAVAASKQAIGKGVLIVMNDNIMFARECTKTDTTNVNTFKCPNTGNCGSVSFGKIRFYVKSTRLNTFESPFDIKSINKMPEVAIVYAAQGESISYMVESAIKHGCKGIIIDGLGDGNIFDNDLDYLKKAREDGIAIVISSRVGRGVVLVNSEMNDTKYHFNTADNLNAQKARILLQLALTKNNNYRDIQKYFDEL